MAVNCKKCKYYYITWDAKFPYGCKAFGMKTKRLPSVEVNIASGKECIKFQKKEEPTLK